MATTFEEILVCYLQHDFEAANRVIQTLEGARLKVWLDRREIRPGESFVVRMSEGLAQAGYVVLLVSSASLQSHHVEREWSSALAEHQTVLLPLKLTEEPLLPPLRDLVSIDFSKSFEQGLEVLVRFFREEESAVGDAPRAGSLSGASRRVVRRVVQHCVDQSAFHNLLWDAEIDAGQLPGESLHEKLVALLHLADRQGTLLRLLDYIHEDHRSCVEMQLRRLLDDAQPSR